METQVQGELRTIPLGDLLPSKTNPRKGFGKEGLSELAESLKASGGVIDPLIVRPLTDTQFEIIAGERRFKAAKLAGLEGLSCLVRDVTDDQALEMQLVENLQREDLSPIEEGQAYRLLMERTKQTAEEVGAKVGKSRRYVYARMKLCDLIPEAAKLVADGTLSASHGDLLGRLQPKDQKQLLKSTVRKVYGGELMVSSIERVEHDLKEKIYRDLDAAPWKKDDPSLVPSAGACTVCPKNSTVNPDLVANGKPNRCADRACYETKWKAWLDAQMDALRKEIGKDPVLLIGEGYYQEVKNALRGYEWNTKQVKKGSCESVEAGIIVAGEGLGQTKYFCRDAKCKVHVKASERKASTGPQRDYQAEQRLSKQIEAQTLEAILAKVAKVGPAEAQVILECLMELGYGLDDSVAEAIARAAKSSEHFGKVAPEQRLRVAYGIALVSTNMAGEAKRLKVDVKAIEKKVKAEMKAEAEAKAKGEHARQVASPKESKKVPTPARKKAAKKGKKR